MCLLVSLFAWKLRNEQMFLQQKERDKTCRRNRCGDFRGKTRVAGMLLHVGKQLWWRPSTKQHLSVLTLLPSHLYLKALLPGSCSTPVHLHTSFGCTSSSLCRGALCRCSRNSDDILTCTYLMRAFAGAPCSFRELHTGTAGKSQGRRKKKIQPSAAQIAKPTSSGIEKEDDADDEDYSLDSEDKESKGQSKRRSLQARHWGVQLASLSQTQLQLAVRWAKLSDEVYESIMLVKALSPKARNGKRRQFNYIGGLLRDVDPVLMDLVLKAGKGGDPPSTFDSSPVNEPNELDFSDETIPAKISQEEMAAQKAAGRWLEGLLSGDEVVTHEVFSYSGDVYLDRQELRKLIREAQQSKDMESALEESHSENGGNETVRSPKLPSNPPSRQQKALYKFLLKLARGVLQSNSSELEV